MVTKPAVRTELRLQGSRQQGSGQQGSGRSRRAALLGAASALLGAGTAHAAAPGALPQDPTVVGGGATFARSGQTLTVDQSTSRAVIDWRSFDIGAGAQTTFNQPSASAIAVNRINAGTDPTHIDGALRANGQVWILNPNGVMFGKGAVVNAAGIVASTANINAGRFMAGDNRLSFTGADRGLVANDGAITVADNGLAAFVAPSVRNSGMINARVGKVTLAAGSTFTLDLAGDRLIEIGLGAGHAVVDQSGAIIDEGGVVTLSARSAGQVVDSVINMSGVVSTASARLAGGQIVLEGDTASVTGAADASGTSGGRIALAANTISVGPQAVLRADSLADGNGGAIAAVAAVQGDYAGTYSARGGPSGGAGGSVETSGKTVHIADAVSVDTRAPAGAMGAWTIDPDNLTVGATGAGTISGGVNSEDATISAGTVVTALNTSSVNLQANTSITVNAAINSSAQSNSNTLTLKDQNADGQLTVNLNAPITLGASQHVAGMANVVNLVSGALIQNGNDVARTTGASTVNLAAGLYAPNATITKSNLTLTGAPGAEIDVNPGTGQVNAINIAGNTSGVTVQGLTIVGEITGSYLTYPFTAAVSRGVVANNGAAGFTITGNTIRNIRTGVLIDGRNTGSVTNNLIDNTKSAISIQYTDGTSPFGDGSGITVTGNHSDNFGNEWGENFHLNGKWDGIAGHNPVSNTAGTAPTSTQTALLAASAANNGWTVQDLGYNISNRTVVTVSPTGLDTNQGSPLANLKTVGAGISAVVAGGTVNVMNGTYVVPSGGGSYLYVNKPLTLAGQSEAGTIIDARHADTYGLRVGPVDGVTLKNFTVYGVMGAGSSYGVKVEGTHNLTVSNVLSQGAYKSEFDFNGVVNASLDNLTAEGAPVGGGPNTNGNGISFTDSQNIVLTNSMTENNVWGGLALYQTNRAGGYLLQETGITVGASNTFHETNPIYAEDQSTLNDFGVLNLTGFDYIVKSPTNPADVYTWFQPTAQGAIDQAALVGLTTAYVQGYGSGVTGTNVFTVGVSTGGQALSIPAAINAAQSGATVNVLNGAYVISSSAPYLGITKGLSLVGQSEAGTIIDAHAASQYGLRVTADNVSLSNFTLLGVTAAGNSYGIKVENNTDPSPDARINNLSISNVASHGARKAQLDLNGVVGATIDHFTADGTSNGFGSGSQAGAGIAITDSANITITNSSTNNNAFGGVALQQSNTARNQQVTGIAIGANNHFSESVPLYAEDTSATNDFGSLNISGFAYIVRPSTNPADVVTVFQPTQQAAIDYAVSAAPSTAWIQGYGSGITGNNIFTVGVGSTGAHQAMSIKAALDAAQTGAAVNVNNGTYVIPGGGTNYLDIGTTLTLTGQSQAGTIIDASGATAYGLRVQADNVTLSNFTLLGSKVTGGYGVKVEPLNLSDPNARINSFAIDHVTIDGATKNTLDLNGAHIATIDNVTAKNAVAGNGIALIDSSNVTITNSTTANNAWGGLRIEEKNASFNQQTNAVTVAANNSFTEASPVYLEDDSTSQNFGTVNIAGFNYAVKSPANPADVYTWFQKTQQGAIDFAAGQSLTAATVQNYSGSGFGDNVYTVGFSTGGQALSIQAAANAAQPGGTINIGPGTYAQNVTGGGPANFNFSNSSLSSFTLGSGASGSGLSGALTANAIALNAPVTLLGALTLNTSAANGTIATGTIDGAQALTLNAGSGQVTLGALGSTTRLGALQVSAGGANLGGDIAAASIALNGPATLLTGLTLDTSAANGIITTGTIDGASAGGQALTFNAGSGQATLGALGSTTRLGALQVSAGRANLGGDITAASIALNGPATLLTGLTLDTSATNGILTTGTIDGASAGGQALTFNAGSGQATLGALGSTTRLGALQVSAGRANLGGNVTAASIALNGPATLLTGLALNTSAAGGTITTGAIDGAQALTLNAGSGQVTLGALGGATRLGALQVSASRTNLGGNLTAASIALNGPATLLTGLTLDASAAGGTITTGAIDGAQALTFNAGSGQATLGSLGGATRLGALQVSASRTNLGGNLTAASIALNGPATLLTGLTLDTSATGGTITTGTIDGASAGAQALTLNAGSGQVTLGALGSTTRLGALQVSAGGANLGGNLTAASIALNGPATLQSSLTLNTSATGGTITTGTIDGASAGAQALTLNAGSGQVTLGALGSTTRLGALQVSAGGANLGGDITAASIALNGPATLLTGLTLDTSAANGIITTGTIDGGQALTFNAGSGQASLGALGSTTRIGALQVSAGGVNLGGDITAASIALNGPATLLTGLTLDTSATNGTITTGTIDGGQALTFNAGSGQATLGALGSTTRLGALQVSAGRANLGGDITAASIALNGPATLLTGLTLDTSATNGTITTGTIDGGQALTFNAGSGQATLGALGSTTRLGALQVSAGRANLGGDITAASIALNGPATLLTGLTLDTSAAGGAIATGTIDGGQALTFNAGSGQASLGALGGATRLGALQVSASRTNLGGNLTAASIALNGPATLLTGLTLDTSATGGTITTGAIDGAQALTFNAGSGQVTLGALGGATRLGALQVSASHTNLGGNLTAASIALNGPATLQSSVTLNTSATNGMITTGAIDASSAGGQALTFNAGSGPISLGSLGSSVRLGAVQAASSTTLTGDTYNAASLTFGGDVVLTAGQTTVNTVPAAGNITVAGSLLGSSDGAQSLVLAAGSGVGSANGDISLQNVGAKAVRLNNLTVSGDDFGAQTVDIAGNFTAKLTGNQVFSSHTLNAGGQVSSTVGGNASGPINAGQSVTFAVAGDLTGAIAGTNVSLNAGTMTNAAVSASQSAAVVANTVTSSSVAAVQNVSMTATTMNASSVSASQSASVNTSSMAGSTVAGTQNVNVNASSVTNSTLSSNQTVTLTANQVQGSNFNASQAVNVSADSVSGSSLTAPKVSASAASFSGNVNASGGASITGGDISGSFSGGSFTIAGTGTVSANVAATSLSVDAPKGTVTGSWQSLDTGSSGRAVSVNNQPVNVQGSGISANQIVVENFTLPTGSVVTKTGEIILPQGQMIGLLSPGGASGAPKLIQVQTVQQLGSLLSEGYTAIIIDLSGHEKASNDDQAVKVSQK